MTNKELVELSLNDLRGELEEIKSLAERSISRLVELAKELSEGEEDD